ncbi:major facilitator superfamily domain-containing protein [Desarmillaria ectypa]|nr:major facilitator superfamily domain-containing protein [Desarmillaria ectypa]
MSRSTNYSRLQVPSQSRSRPRSLRTTTTSMLTDPQGLVSEGAVSERDAELLHEFVHPHHHEAEETLIGGPSDDADLDQELNARALLPWWKRPSSIWLLVMMPFSSIAWSCTIAPKVEIYTQLACAVRSPDVYYDQLTGLVFTNTTMEATLDVRQDRSVTVFFRDMLETPKNANSNGCASDPVVQATVAKLAAAMTATMGVLGCLTSAAWGSYSDRHGRTAVLGISVIGILSTDFNFLVVNSYYERLPGGYWFLLLGPIIEGCLGGLSTAIATMHAYIADTSNSATRSRVFSLSLGLVFSGFALGPTLGSLLIRATGQTISVFYVATFLHLCYALLIWLIVPESLTQAQRRKSTIKHHQSDPRTGVLKRLFGFLGPLSVFLPEMNSTDRHPLKRLKRDWNLTLIAVAYGLTLSLMGSYTYKFQYAAASFDWTSETASEFLIGYWLSLVGAARAFFLTLILPLAIKLCKPKPKDVSIGEREPFIPSESNDPRSSHSDSDRSSSFHMERHSSRFDLGLARVSLFIDIVSYVLLGSTTNPLIFTLSSMLGSMGTGFSPAVQSVALELYTQRGGTESGRLFGALSAIQALSSQIIGPSLYAFVYIKTVATFPRAIFFVGAASVCVSLACLALIRLADPEKHPHMLDTEEVAMDGSVRRDDTLVDTDEAVSDLRGRTGSSSSGR